MNIFKTLSTIPNTLNSVVGIFKATDKGLLSSRRTISGAIVGYAIYFMESNNDISDKALFLVVIGIIPVATLSIVEAFKISSSKK